MAGGIEVIENIWIPLADGTRLAARLWLPEKRPASAILEYIPYRKRDGTRGRDEPMHGFFAEQGFAAIRVDMAGTGESDGLCHDEYTATELDDAVEVIAWISRQDWCSGSVGMMGKSWGGFNCLQVAALRPPALKAVVTVCSTVDRFGDDIHYMGGCLLNDNQWWGTIMLAYQARPLDGRIAGPDWRADWLRRLESMPLWPALWMAHPTRDSYWKHGSVSEDFSAIKVPVLAFGGWADAYTNAVPALLEGLDVPRRGIIGPWAHLYPHDGYPAPAIGFLDEASRWWARFLDGIENGVDGEPMLTAYIEDRSRPTTTLTASSGRFVAEQHWPSPNIRPRSWVLGRNRLEDGDVAGETLSIRSPAYAGSTSGEWMAAGCVSEMPADQRLDDGFSLCFDSGPLEADLDMLGRPEIELAFVSDSPTAQIAVRLNDVSPDGASLRVSYAVRNLLHRDGFETPEPLVPGEVCRIRIALKVAGHRFKAGHRIRLAISTAYWPLIWPSRDAATLSVLTGESRLTLPVRPIVEGEPKVVLSAPRQAAATPVTKMREGLFDRTVTLDHVTDTMTTVTDGRGGVFGEGVLRFDDIDVTLSHDLKRVMSISGDDPLSARAEMTERYEMIVAGRTFSSDITTLLVSDVETFTLTARLVVHEEAEKVFERAWSEHFPRLPL
jgi:hypothetical protein